jgi:hypothetical protein
LRTAAQHKAIMTPLLSPSLLLLLAPSLLWLILSVGTAIASVCAGACRWTEPTANYDNILLATFTLWQISTTELWVNTMYTAISAVGVDQQPRAGYNFALALFFIAFIVFGGEEAVVCCTMHWRASTIVRDHQGPTSCTTLVDVGFLL